ncbi:UNVERIFIED_CONTAM: hypothetical protein FKN15_025497 [Acipenser sinensis]
MANDRLRSLEEVEKEIGVVLQCAGNIILELSKEKHNASLLDRQLSQFTGCVSRVESELSGQIRYLTQLAFDFMKHSEFILYRGDAVPVCL